MVAKSQDKLFLHVARVMACLAVVAIHSVGLSTALLSVGPEASWWTKTVVTSFSVWAVPVFVMISGALLLDPEKKETAQQFYTKRCRRIFIPMMVWIPFYFVVDHFYKGDSLSLRAILDRIIYSSYDHLYFLVLIVQLYLITPMLRGLLKSSTISSQAGLIAIFFLIAIFWKKTSFAGTMFIPFIGYYLLGSFLLKYNTNTSKKLLLASLTGFVTSALLIIVLTYSATISNELRYIQDSYYYSHNKPLVIILAISAFMIIQSSTVAQKVRSLFSLDLVKKLSSASFGIYILHPLILYTTLYLLTKFITIEPLSWWIMLVFIPWSFLMSFIFTIGLQRLRYFKLLV